MLGDFESSSLLTSEFQVNTYVVFRVRKTYVHICLPVHLPFKLAWLSLIPFFSLASLRETMGSEECEYDSSANDHKYDGIVVMLMRRSI